MTDSALFEALGRKQMELDVLHGEYDRLLALLAQVVDGRIPTATVRVDLQHRRWEVVVLRASQSAQGNGSSAQTADELDDRNTPSIESLSRPPTRKEA